MHGIWSCKLCITQASRSSATFEFDFFICNYIQILLRVRGSIDRFDEKNSTFYRDKNPDTRHYLRIMSYGETIELGAEITTSYLWVKIVNLFPFSPSDDGIFPAGYLETPILIRFAYGDLEDDAMF